MKIFVISRQSILLTLNAIWTIVNRIIKSRSGKYLIMVMSVGIRTIPIMAIPMN